MHGTSLAMVRSMRLAIPVWCDRVSPVFDVAGQVLLVDLTDGRETVRHLHPLAETSLLRRADALATLGVDALVCGAISRALEAALLAKGVRVIARISGETERIIQAFIGNHLGDDAFRMPGCSQSGAVSTVPGRRRRRCGHRHATSPPPDSQGEQRNLP